MHEIFTILMLLCMLTQANYKGQNRMESLTVIWN